MTRKIDYRTALRTLKRVIKQKGDDYVASEGGDCMYSNPDGTPNCVVGFALDLLDIERPQFTPPGVGYSGLKDRNGWLFDNTNYKSRQAEKLVDWLAENGVEFTPKASQLYALTQYYQDEGIAWGESLTRALEDLKEQENAGK